MEVLRASITAFTFVRESLWVYAIATRFGWEEYTELISPRGAASGNAAADLSTLALCKFHRKR